MNNVPAVPFGFYFLKRVIIVLFLAAGFFFFLHNAAAFQMTKQTSFLTRFIRNAATETVPHCTAGKIWLEVSPPESNPMIMQLFSETLLHAGKEVTKSSLTDNQKVAVDVRALHRLFNKLNDSGYQRTEAMNIGVTVENNADKSVIWSHDFDESASDTLDAAEYMQLKNQDDSLPHSFFESYLEPILITTAAIVVLVLLFTVRGS